MTLVTPPTAVSPAPAGVAALSSAGWPSPTLGPLRRFTVSEYHRMIEAGILGEDDPVELLEGWIAYKMPRNPPHDGTIDLAAEALRSRLVREWCVRVQNALTTADSEPEPDLAVTKARPRDYVTRHPGPTDVALVIEVAESSLARDRSDKGRTYARAAIPVYWVINVSDGWVEVYSDPTGPAPNPQYRHRQDYGPADAIPLNIPGAPAVPIPVSELLP